MSSPTIEELHKDNDTPRASDADIKRMDTDTPRHGDAAPGASVTEGVGASPLPTNTDHMRDPKSGGTPVHPAPGAERPSS
ncbi:MAG: hypothetical protein Q8O56_02915 [Solirubrobacteraceae bacterium]|nr:hypothetical protein [Solirubrobacteraceae bacterium]